MQHVPQGIGEGFTAGGLYNHANPPWAVFSSPSMAVTTSGRWVRAIFYSRSTPNTPHIGASFCK